MSRYASARLATAMWRGAVWMMSASLVCLLSSATASAQVTSGSIEGAVEDAQGGVIPGATVILVNEQQKTRSAPVITNELGEFVFPNIAAGSYTLEITMASFKTLQRTGISVSPGARIAVGRLTIELGGNEDVVFVNGAPPEIQASSGERSFVVSNEQVANLPLPTRSFSSTLSLTPGVTSTGGAGNGPTRIGSGGGTNYTLDGVNANETGSDRLLFNINVESIDQVKVVTSNYQAEFGRSSGLQVVAVTKSGTNSFRGSLYDVERNSAWGANTRTNILNGDPKVVSKERDWGFSLGGPVGKPGGNNKLFFFYAQEFQPRTGGGNVVRYRLPTALERQGDFSQTRDNLGNLYPYIKDPLLPGACNATTQAGCFADGGVLGKIPASRLYQTGLDVLNWYPLPNIQNVPAGQAYNYELTRPVETAMAYQPVVKVDYQPWTSLRVAFRYSAWIQRNQTFNGTLPGFNDTRMSDPSAFSRAVTLNYAASPTLFIEGSYGQSGNRQSGSPLPGAGPVFSTVGWPMSPADSRLNAFPNLPLLYPNAGVIDPSSQAYQMLQSMNPTPSVWDGTQLLLPPAFLWGNRVAAANVPPTVLFPASVKIGSTDQIAASITKVAGRHTFKFGFYNVMAGDYEGARRISGTIPNVGVLSFANDSVGTNPFDTSFGFANAAIGSFSSYTQDSTYVEAGAIARNTEGYAQDNWKVNNHLTLDYGLRIVNQAGLYDKRNSVSNFVPDTWNRTLAPLLYTAGCANGVSPCSGTNRQAVDPRTGQVLGPNSGLLIGTVVPGTGNSLNGLVIAPAGEPNWKSPTIVLAPRFGMAYDLTGTQRWVLRGGAGVFYDRPSASQFIGGIQNPPLLQTATVRAGQLQSLGTSGAATTAAQTLITYQANQEIPRAIEWNGGMQMMLPWNIAFDAAYTGEYDNNLFATTRASGQGAATNINAIDFGTAFLPQYQDPTLAASATPGATAVSTDLMRPFQGYGAMTSWLNRYSRSYHSVQVALNRRLSEGFSVGFYDTISLWDRQTSPARWQHNADGTFGYRDDQEQADELLGNNHPQTHIMKANFIWQLPSPNGGPGVGRMVNGLLRDWQVSGVWSGATGAAYDVSYLYANGGANVNITGSPDYAGRVRITGDPGSGCSDDAVRQFNTSAFQGPLPRSVGLESGSLYLRGCFVSQLDMSFSRRIGLGGGRNVQLRIDVFNLLNQAAIIARNTVMNLTSPTDPVTITNLPFDASGNPIAARTRPSGGGFGVATDYQAPRSVQIQARFSF